MFSIVYYYFLCLNNNIHLFIVIIFAILVMMKQEKEKSIKGFKTILVGNSQVGKSTFLVRYIEGYFSPQVATIGLDFRAK